MTLPCITPLEAAFACKLVEARPSEDCGCPEEEWIMDTLVVTIHLEEDGSSHIAIDAGDWEHDWFSSNTDMAKLRQEAADYIGKLYSEDKT